MKYLFVLMLISGNVNAILPIDTNAVMKRAHKALQNIGDDCVKKGMTAVIDSNERMYLVKCTVIKEVK